MLRDDPPLSSPLWGLSEGGLAGGHDSLSLTDARTGFCVLRRKGQRMQKAGRRRASERAARRAERFPFPGGQRPTSSQACSSFLPRRPLGAENGGLLRAKRVPGFFSLVRGAALPARPSKAKGETIPRFSKVVAAKKVKHKAQLRGTSPHANNRAEIGFVAVVGGACIKNHAPRAGGSVRSCAGGPKKARCGTEIRRKV